MNGWESVGEGRLDASLEAIRRHIAADSSLNVEVVRLEAILAPERKILYDDFHTGALDAKMEEFIGFIPLIKQVKNDKQYIRKLKEFFSNGVEAPSGFFKLFGKRFNGVCISKKIDTVHTVAEEGREYWFLVCAATHNVARMKIVDELFTDPTESEHPAQAMKLLVDSALKGPESNGWKRHFMCLKHMVFVGDFVCTDHYPRVICPAAVIKVRFHRKDQNSINRVDIFPSFNFELTSEPSTLCINEVKLPGGDSTPALKMEENVEVYSPYLSRIDDSQRRDLLVFSDFISIPQAFKNWIYLGKLDMVELLTKGNVPMKTAILVANPYHSRLKGLVSFLNYYRIQAPPKMREKMMKVMAMLRKKSVILCGVTSLAGNSHAVDLLIPPGDQANRLGLPQIAWDQMHLIQGLGYSIEARPPIVPYAPSPLSAAETMRVKMEMLALQKSMGAAAREQTKWGRKRQTASGDDYEDDPPPGNPLRPSNAVPPHNNPAAEVVTLSGDDEDEQRQSTSMSSPVSEEPVQFVLPPSSDTPASPVSLSHPSSSTVFIPSTAHANTLPHDSSRDPRIRQRHSSESDFDRSNDQQHNLSTSMGLPMVHSSSSSSSHLNPPSPIHHPPPFDPFPSSSSSSPQPVPPPFIPPPFYYNLSRPPPSSPLLRPPSPLVRPPVFTQFNPVPPPSYSLYGVRSPPNPSHNLSTPRTPNNEPQSDSDMDISEEGEVDSKREIVVGKRRNEEKMDFEESMKRKKRNEEGEDDEMRGEERREMSVHSIDSQRSNGNRRDSNSRDFVGYLMEDEEDERMERRRERSASRPLPSTPVSFRIARTSAAHHARSTRTSHRDTPSPRREESLEEGELPDTPMRRHSVWNRSKGGEERKSVSLLEPSDVVIVMDNELFKQIKRDVWESLLSMADERAGNKKQRILIVMHEEFDPDTCDSSFQSVRQLQQIRSELIYVMDHNAEKMSDDIVDCCNAIQKMAGREKTDMIYLTPNIDSSNVRNQKLEQIGFKVMNGSGVVHHITSKDHELYMNYDH